MSIKRGDVVLVILDPTVGSEIRKTRPCLVVSPDELNGNLGTVIVAPMTTRWHAFPTRISCAFQGKTGYVVLDQIRTIDSDRVARPLGRLPEPTLSKVLHGLQEMFAE
ncbi:MAG: type II toxin-antitoxin system PemK/MazF family toxin [Spirochaetia bacterium]|jgi:mRNA interferase MazF